MINKIDTSRRSEEDEIMDDFELKGAELEKTLKDLEKINKWLGGNKITLQGIEEILEDPSEKKIIHIVDVGCGNGAVLRQIAKWGRKKHLQFQLTGVDANAYAIETGKRLSLEFPEIGFECLNVFDRTFRNREYDIVLCTLTLHHFKDPEVSTLLKIFYSQAKLGVVINDLHRSKLAYRLFQLFCSAFINNDIARKDGLISILRGFKKEELKSFAAKIRPAKHQISWKWAFRYQWIIKKIDLN